jgi:hypothetical protein
MNYAVMQEFAVDKNSGQFKAPFNEIQNEHKVSTPEDTAVITPNSDTPYSVMWLDLRAEPMVISVPAIDKDRYYAVQMIGGNTYNFGYIGSRTTGTEAGDYLVVGPDWKGETPAGIKKVFTSTTPFTLALIRTQLFNPTTCRTSRKFRPDTKCSRAFDSPRRPPHRRSISDVRRKEPIADQAPDQSLPHQLSDVVSDEEECRRFADTLHPERQSRRR